MKLLLNSFLSNGRTLDFNQLVKHMRVLLNTLSKLKPLSKENGTVKVKELKQKTTLTY